MFPPFQKLMVSASTNRRSPKFARLFVAAAILLSAEVSAHAADAYKWSVQYLIDASRAVFGRSQKVSPRHNRGLAASPDGKFLYAGYHHSFNNTGEVRRIAIDVADFDRATLAILPGVMAKAIATDEKGRVYVSNQTEILVFDATLQRRELTIPAGGACEGLAVTHEGKDLVLYGTDRDYGVIHRWVISEDKDGVADAAPGGFAGDGELKIPGASDLRGIAIDAQGRLWIADLKGGKVFRMDRDGTNLNSVRVPSALAIAFDGGRAFVTRYTDRAITVIDDGLNILGTLNVPWEELELSPFGNNRGGALGGIAIVPGKGIFVANEAGQTANQKSTYGKADDHSDFIGKKLYRDAFEDDNEPILRATPVTTAP